MKVALPMNCNSSPSFFNTLTPSQWFGVTVLAVTLWLGHQSSQAAEGPIVAPAASTPVPVEISPAPAAASTPVPDVAVVSRFDMNLATPSVRGPASGTLLIDPPNRFYLEIRPPVGSPALVAASDVVLASDPLTEELALLCGMPMVALGRDSDSLPRRPGVEGLTASSGLDALTPDDVLAALGLA